MKVALGIFLGLLFGFTADACTTVVVGKKVSATGRDWSDCPYAVVPSRKIDAGAVKQILSSHYEGTPDEIPVGTDGRRHDESVRTGICRASTLHSSVWLFGDSPADIRLDLAAGSPCCHPYETSYPLHLIQTFNKERK